MQPEPVYTPGAATAATLHWALAPRGGWRRVLLKLSGEAFAGSGSLGVDPDVVHNIADQIAEVVSGGAQVCVVIGGGNYFRGAQLHDRGMDRGRADYMGMLGTVMNCLALQDFLDKAGVETRVQTAIPMSQVAEPYVPRRAIRHLEKGRVVIFGAGLGVPFFSTDTCAAQRALEVGAQVVLMAKGVDGVYDDDPRTNPDAVRFESLDYSEVLARGLKVADATAISLCQGNDLPIIVFNLLTDGNIARAVAGERIGTLISAEARGEQEGVMIDEALFEAEEKMEKAISVAKDDFATIRTGRATPQMFSRILVDYYGSPTPINQLASFQTPEARMILISPFDKGSMHNIEKAIRDSDLGVNPVDDGQIIRVVLPVLTQERRKEYIKTAKAKAEDTRVSIRNIRRHAKDALDRLQKDGDAGEDDIRRAEKALDELTSRHVGLVDELLRHKESELLEI